MNIQVLRLTHFYLRKITRNTFLNLFISKCCINLSILPHLNRSNSEKHFTFFDTCTRTPTPPPPKKTKQTNKKTKNTYEIIFCIHKK
jgi:hypothetical protein